MRRNERPCVLVPNAVERSKQAFEPPLRGPNEPFDLAGVGPSIARRMERKRSGFIHGADEKRRRPRFAGRQLGNRVCEQKLRSDDFKTDGEQRLFFSAVCA